jgi:hypothetical protein
MPNCRRDLKLSMEYFEAPLVQQRYILTFLVSNLIFKMFSFLVMRVVKNPKIFVANLISQLFYKVFKICFV